LILEVRLHQRLASPRRLVTSPRGHLFVPSICCWDHATLSTQESRRHFSDRLTGMGYSPMSPAAPLSPGKDAESKMPTAKDAGGVWAPTSAKRDKISELKVAKELNQDTLDDAATPEQLQDLYLADGVHLIAKVTDSTADEETQAIKEFDAWLSIQQAQLPSGLDETQMDAQLATISEHLTASLTSLPAAVFLREVRDFCDPGEVPEEELQKLQERDLQSQDGAFDNAVTRFRLQLAQAAVEHLKMSWKILTTVSDADVDRAAVQGKTIEREAKSIPLAKIHDVLRAYAAGNCKDRFDAIWNLMDRDGDGLLDEEEMNRVTNLCVAPVQAALVTLVQDALDAYPVRATMPKIEDAEIPKPKGWRQRRKDTKTKKTLLKMFQRAAKNHFIDEIEINHRLRCIYAWSEKAHQDNKLDSVMVDAGWSGRKRFVELQPKISLPEFREVQQEHFAHLDRVGSEILKSFREDLWVAQGKGRQDRELVRDCLLFLTAVSVIDYLIVIS
jgi:hypothetical protein